MNITLDTGARLPTKAHNNDAGLDLYLKASHIKHNKSFYCMCTKTYTFKPNKTCVLDTGVHVEIEPGYVGLILPRSSVSIKGLLVHTGVIDSGYTGSIGVIVTNLSSEPLEYLAGDKIAQLVIFPINQDSLNIVDSLTTSDRGDKGFGSSGK